MLLNISILLKKVSPFVTVPVTSGWGRWHPGPPACYRAPVPLWRWWNGWSPQSAHLSVLRSEENQMEFLMIIWSYHICVYLCIKLSYDHHVISNRYILIVFSLEQKFNKGWVSTVPLNIPFGSPEIWAKTRWFTPNCSWGRTQKLDKTRCHNFCVFAAWWRNMVEHGGTWSWRSGEKAKTCKVTAPAGVSRSWTSCNFPYQDLRGTSQAPKVEVWLRNPRNKIASNRQMCVLLCFFKRKPY